MFAMCASRMASNFMFASFYICSCSWKNVRLAILILFFRMRRLGVIINESRQHLRIKRVKECHCSCRASHAPGEAVSSNYCRHNIPRASLEPGSLFFLNSLADVDKLLQDDSIAHKLCVVVNFSFDVKTHVFVKAIALQK
jgi:hypothetical protein